MIGWILLGVYLIGIVPWTRWMSQLLYDNSYRSAFWAGVVGLLIATIWPITLGILGTFALEEWIKIKPSRLTQNLKHLWYGKKFLKDKT